MFPSSDMQKKYSRERGKNEENPIKYATSLAAIAVL